jgi:5'-nucleotidase
LKTSFPKLQSISSHKFLVAIVLNAVLLLFFCMLLSGGAQEQPFAMTIVHTNDLHAHDQPYLENGKSVGGFARIAYLIKHIKAHTPNTVVIDAGDIFQGTPFYQLYHGQVEVELLNQAGYDIYTVGNHEFDNGPANLAKQLSLAHFDVLSANLDTTAEPQLAHLIKPSVIKNIGGQQVGFVGGITPELLRISLTTGGAHPYGVLRSNSQDVVPSDWYKPIADEVQSLQKAGVNKIVVVTHCGVDLDRQLAQAIPGIDVIVGGHSHTKLTRPIIVAHNDGTATYIVQTGCYGKALGKLHLSFDKNGKILGDGTNYKLIPISDNIPEDPTVAAFIAAKAKPVEAMKKEVLGRAQSLFDNKFRGCRSDSALGDLICDAIAESGTSYGVTISLQNRGGIRGPIRPGVITKEEIEEDLPFESTIIYATISSTELLKVLEHSVEQRTSGPFLDVHGLKFGYDAKQPPGHRITFVLAQSHNGSFKPVNPTAQYKIAVNSYTFFGGESYSFSGAIHVVDSKVRTAQVLEQYLRKHPRVVPHIDGRITAAN